jgi:hypothetical protein
MAGASEIRPSGFPALWLSDERPFDPFLPQMAQIKPKCQEGPDPIHLCPSVKSVAKKFGLENPSDRNVSIRVVVWDPPGRGGFASWRKPDGLLPPGSRRFLH